MLDARSLIDQLHLVNAIRVLRIKLAFPPEVFALAVRPLIDAYAEWVQLLPVGTSLVGRGCHPQAGGQLLRACVSAIRALDRRRGQILPRGAAPEVIGELAHRWTYAVFVAALLRDAGRVDAGLRVWISDGAERLRVWRPTEGSMRECGASHYRVEAFSAGVSSGDRDPVAPVNPGASALALRLFEGRVPAAIRDWLNKDQALMAELHACLTGQVDKAGAIGSLLADDARCDMQARSVAVGPAPGAVFIAPAVEADVAPEHGVTESDQTEFLEDVRPAERGLASSFMHWLDQGIVAGRLTVNQHDGLVHVVAEGLLLVSPGIFRRFAKHRTTGSRVGADVAGLDQREGWRDVMRAVLREGWHLSEGGAVNMLCYERRRSGGTTIRIHGIVIREPQRVIRTLPGIDPALVRIVDGAGSPAA